MNGFQAAAFGVAFSADKPVTTPPPAQADWGMIIVFTLLALAVAGLGYSLIKQLRKVQRSADAGVYDDQTSKRIS